MLGIFRSRRVLVTALLGFGSGIPLYLTGATLTAWMTAEEVDLKTIGFFSLVGLPYTLKWTWAPLLDRYRLPWLGRRRGWLIVSQLALIAAIAWMGTIDPHGAPGTLAAAAVLVAFLSASQDVVVDAFNTDGLAPDERAAGAALAVGGYRVAMVTSGALALALADRVVWPAIYAACAALMLVGVAGTLLAREADEPRAPSRLIDAVGRPLLSLIRQPGAAIVIAFVVWFRLCDFFATAMMIPFLKRGLGFTFTEIATLYQLLGLAGTVAGGLVGGALVAKHGVRRCLLAFGILQAATNLAWAGLATLDRSLPLLGVTVVLDNVAGSMAGGAFVAYLMSRCDRAVSATQFALYTSLSSVIARLGGYLAADLVVDRGWPAFWLATAALVVPALALLPFLPRERATSS